MRYSIILLFILCSCASSSKEPIRIAAASNTQFALAEIIQTFQSETGIECEMSIASSGKLTAQIISGAPFNIFLSANRLYPEKIKQANLAYSDPKTYAYGNLALWTTRKDQKPSLDLLSDESTQYIALPNPELAPYGIASMEVVSGLEIFDKIADKFVIGESISQTNQFINTGHADIGFTALSTFKNPHFKYEGLWITIPPQLYTEIGQDVIMLRSDAKMDETKQFYNYLFSMKAKTIFEQHGYTVPN